MSIQKARQTIAESKSDLGIRAYSKEEAKMIDKHLKKHGKTVIVSRNALMPTDVKASKKVRVVEL